MKDQVRAGGNVTARPLFRGLTLGPKVTVLLSSGRTLETPAPQSVSFLFGGLSEITQALYLVSGRACGQDFTNGSPRLTTVLTAVLT